MMEYGQGSGPVLTGLGSTGIAVLPNTGANGLFVVLSYVATAVGLAIIASTAARILIAKRTKA